jgi:putative endonuclease
MLRPYSPAPSDDAQIGKIICRLHHGQRGQRHAVHRVTSDLIGRVRQHKNGTFDGFTKKYKVHMLVWYEQHATADTAIYREKQLKEWRRLWKLRIIEEMNPEWRDLSADFTA